ncbi:hypothetical protein BJQ89_00824 [Arthrobacter sp. ES1]|nr:hypothetical protein [Arthrobacter sp. ES1]
MTKFVKSLYKRGNACLPDGVVCFDSAGMVTALVRPGSSGRTDPQSSRTVVIRKIVLQMPPVVAQALGYHHTSTTRIAAEAGSPWSEYAPGNHSR